MHFQIQNPIRRDKASKTKQHFNELHILYIQATQRKIRNMREENWIRSQIRNTFAHYIVARKNKYAFPE